MNPAILLVDDDAVSLTLLTKLVEKLGYDVHHAQDGLQAVEVLERTAIDLVISDYEMPRLDGLQLLKKVSSDFPSLPFVLVTAYSNFKVIQEAWEAGAFDFFEKPVFIERLRQTIEIALQYGHFKLARRRFPLPSQLESDPTLLDLTVIRELAAALNPPDLMAIVSEYDVFARIELEQLLRFAHAGQSEAVQRTAHRLAGTSLNLGLAQLSRALRVIEAEPKRPIENPAALEEKLELSIYWLKHHLADISEDLAS